jgi:hypothetical protein
VNWQSEAHLSWNWLQWMREVMAEPVEPIGRLSQILNRAPEWAEAIADDRHSTGDLNRISSNEYFVYAASMMSRDAKLSIDFALKHARAWEADEPLRWSSLPPEAMTEWETADYVINMVLQAWIMLWNELAALQDTLSASCPEEALAQWQALADQAAQTVTGTSTAAWAQRR